MTERDIEVAEINARMKELGYNQRSLSMAATGKPDNLRNLFNGKSKNMRSDNYKAVISILWPESGRKIPSAPKTKSLSDIEVGLLGAIQSLVTVLSTRKILKEDDLKLILNHQVKEYRTQDQPDAAEVLTRLLASLDSKPRAK